MLSHIMEDGPVGFASLTRNAAERNYSLLDKEGTTTMIASKEFHKQLYGHCFVIMSDQKPLVSQFGELEKQVPIMASPRIQWWTITLYGYEYQIHYKAGRSHGNVDCLAGLMQDQICASHTYFSGDTDVNCQASLQI